METVPEIHTKKTSFFVKGMEAGVPIAFGYMPVALTFGLISSATGLTVFEAVLMSVIVFAGAAQYMALSMIALGSSVAEVVVATFIVNFRHLLMSASIHERAEADSKWKRAFYGFYLTDEVFAVASTYKPPIRTNYIIGIGIVAYGSWVGFTGIGYFTGAFLPGLLQESMGIALYALFIALLIPSIKKEGKYVIQLACLGAIFNGLFQLWMTTGWSLMMAIIFAVVVYEVYEQLLLGRKRQ